MFSVNSITYGMFPRIHKGHGIYAFTNTLALDTCLFNLIHMLLWCNRFPFRPILSIKWSQKGKEWTESAATLLPATVCAKATPVHMMLLHGSGKGTSSVQARSRDRIHSRARLGCSSALLLPPFRQLSAVRIPNTGAGWSPPSFSQILF